MDSNHRPAGYESAALTAELRRRAAAKSSSGSDQPWTSSIPSSARSATPPSVTWTMFSTPARARSEAAIELRLPTEHATAQPVPLLREPVRERRRAARSRARASSPRRGPPATRRRRGRRGGARRRRAAARPGRGMSSTGDRVGRSPASSHACVPPASEPADRAEADRLEQAREPSRLLVGRGGHDHVALGVDDPGRPRPDGGADHRHVDRSPGRGRRRTRAGSRPSMQRRARVEEILHARGREGLERPRLVEERPAVQRDDAREVRRLRRERPGQRARRTRPRPSSFAKRL